MKIESSTTAGCPQGKGERGTGGKEKVADVLAPHGCGGGALSRSRCRLARCRGLVRNLDRFERLGRSPRRAAVFGGSAAKGSAEHVRERRRDARERGGIDHNANIWRWRWRRRRRRRRRRWWWWRRRWRRHIFRAATSGARAGGDLALDSDIRMLRIGDIEGAVAEGEAQRGFGPTMRRVRRCNRWLAAEGEEEATVGQ